MKNINQNAAHHASTARLSQLTEAHNAAKLEESSLLTQLSDQPESKPSALARAVTLLAGGTPALRQDSEGLHLRLAGCREKRGLLVKAIEEQRAVIAGLVQAQSVIVNVERNGDHVKAAQGIKTALAGLRAALDVGRCLRGEIEAAGYRCTLQPLTNSELDFKDSQSTIARFKAEVDNYLVVAELSAAKSLNIRLLYETSVGAVNDVLIMNGPEAAALVGRGHGEVTTAKPNRASRPQAGGLRGTSMANALSA
jgi:hypothetical protein